MKQMVGHVLPISQVYFATPSNLARKLFFYITCAGHFYYEEGYNLVRNQYNSYLIMYILNGSAKVSYHNKVYSAVKGDTVFLNCYKPHGYVSGSNLETLWVHFDSLQAAEYYNEINKLHDDCIIQLKNPYPVINGINKIIHMHSEGGNIEEAVQSAYLTKILAALFSNPQLDTDEKSTLIEDTISYIEAHISEELCINDLAKHVAVSKFHFSRVFKKETGYTVQEYITKARITNAKVLLKSTGLSLKEIAFRCGFSNASSFSNAFKRNAAMTPGKFRKTII